MSIPRNMNPAEPDFDLFSSPFYLIAHVDFKYHEDLDRVMQKYEVDRTTYRLLSVQCRLSIRPRHAGRTTLECR